MLSRHPRSKYVRVRKCCGGELQSPFRHLSYVNWVDEVDIQQFLKFFLDNIFWKRIHSPLRLPYRVGVIFDVNVVGAQIGVDALHIYVILDKCLFFYS